MWKNLPLKIVATADNQCHCGAHVWMWNTVLAEGPTVDHIFTKIGVQNTKMLYEADNLCIWFECLIGTEHDQ